MHSTLKKSMFFLPLLTAAMVFGSDHHSKKTSVFKESQYRPVSHDVSLIQWSNTRQQSTEAITLLPLPEECPVPPEGIEPEVIIESQHKSEQHLEAQKSSMEIEREVCSCSCATCCMGSLLATMVVVIVGGTAVGLALHPHP